MICNEKENEDMFKTKINLVTMADIYRFVSIVTEVGGDVKLVDGTGYVVNAKSVLGCIASIEWAETYCVSDVDIYNKISEFAE